MIDVHLTSSCFSLVGSLATSFGRYQIDPTKLTKSRPSPSSIRRAGSSSAGGALVIRGLSRARAEACPNCPVYGPSRLDQVP